MARQGNPERSVEVSHEDRRACALLDRGLHRSAGGPGPGRRGNGAWPRRGWGRRVGGPAAADGPGGDRDAGAVGLSAAAVRRGCEEGGQGSQPINRTTDRAVSARAGARPVVPECQTWNGSVPGSVWTVQEPSLRKLAAVA